VNAEDNRKKLTLLSLTVSVSVEVVAVNVLVSLFVCEQSDLSWVDFYGYFMYLHSYLCLQCFDTVGWAAGRASGL